jgi:hypothetical protein
VVIVVGAEGAPEYAQTFARSADHWAEAATRGQARVVQVGRHAPNGTGDKEELRTLLDAECRRTTPPLWLILIGHGTFDGREAKFNLRGTDVSGQELAEWLKPCRRPLAVIDCSSASAPFLNKLSADGRVVVTATRTGQENNYARFGEYLSAAIADPTVDLDKDGQTSLLEAFIAASHRTEEFYKQQGRLATEHALLDDNGDGLGIQADWFQGIRATRSARDGAPLDGPRAHQWHLVRTGAEQVMSADARSRRDALELQIEALRGKKASMDETLYYAQLEPLLLQLARLYAEQPDAKQ